MSALTALKKALHGDARSALLLRNILASFLIKGWSALVQLLAVPLTLSCLGVYENGVWLTVSSVLLWIDNLDIGLGNGLRNRLAAAIARDDTETARQMVSSTFAMLVVIIVPTLLVLVGLEVLVDNYSLFNVDPTAVSDLDTILIASTCLVCGTFVLKFLGNFYMGLQLPAISNLLVTCGNTLALLGTAVVYWSGIHSLLLIAIVNTASPLVVYLCCYPITFCGRYRQFRPSVKYIRWKAITDLFSIGFKFFVLQVSGVVLFFSSNIIISRLFSPSMVTPYQIANRYFMIAILLFTIVCVPYWSATTDAFERKDFGWIRRASHTLNLLVVGAGLLIALMIAASPFVYEVWIGHKATVPFGITLVMGIYEFILIVSTRYSYVLNGMGALNLQLYTTIFAAVIFIPLAVLAGSQTHDINWLLIVMCAVNLPGLVVNAIQYHKIINGTAKGLWKR